MELLATAPAEAGISPRKILMIGPPHQTSRISLDLHELLTCKNLESSLEIISQFRPDLVILFANKRQIAMEEHVMTWLIEGFRGKFIVFDPKNRLKDWEILLDSQVIDDYFPGPVSPVRFASIIKSQMTRDLRFASPRAMTTFDLFRNLFDRGLNALFFFNEELTRCVAANLKAEQMTGFDFRRLQKTPLKDLIHKDFYDKTLKVIRRATRQYYDSRGASVLANGHQPERMVEFSCGVFKFGRKHFVKLELQERSKASQQIPAGQAKNSHSLKNLMLQEDLVRVLNGTKNLPDGKKGSLTILQLAVSPGEQFHRIKDLEGEANQFFMEITEFIQGKIREEDMILKVGPDQLAVIFPGITHSRVENIRNRLAKALDQVSGIKNEMFQCEMKLEVFPEKAYAFLNFLHPAGYFSQSKSAAPEIEGKIH